MLRGTWSHRALADIADGVPPRKDFPARLRADGLVDLQEVPPILAAEGRDLLNQLGSVSGRVCAA
jgi:hypothetical protein